jgi:hypothetical protein
MVVGNMKSMPITTNVVSSKWNEIKSGLKHHWFNGLLRFTRFGNVFLCLSKSRVTTLWNIACSKQVWMGKDFKIFILNPKPHWWCNGKRARLKCGRSCVLAVIGLDRRL